jgi:hypothetical protein
MVPTEKRWLLVVGVSAAMLASMAVPAKRVCDSDFVLPEFQDEQGPLFRGAGVDFQVPEGFAVADPFSTMTRYWAERWSQSTPSRSVRVAHFASQEAVSQVFMYLGNRSELESFLAEAGSCHASDASVSESDTREVTTQDGITVTLRTAQRQGSNSEFDNDVTMMLGFAEVGDQLLVINAGGITGQFDTQTVCDLIETVRLGS